MTRRNRVEQEPAEIERSLRILFVFFYRGYSITWDRCVEQEDDLDRSDF